MILLRYFGFNFYIIFFSYDQSFSEIVIIIILTIHIATFAFILGPKAIASQTVIVIHTLVGYKTEILSRSASEIYHEMACNNPGID